MFLKQVYPVSKALVFWRSTGPNSVIIGCMGKESKHTGDHGLSVLEAKPKLKRPSMYKVVLHNDDYTPMEFVVTLLGKLFAMPRAKATQVMLHVHTKGKGVCGVFTKDIAETKVAQVNEYSRQNQHPLLCAMEEA